jgi:hypothetical protein
MSSSLPSNCEERFFTATIAPFVVVVFVASRGFEITPAGR